MKHGIWQRLLPSEVRPKKTKRRVLIGAVLAADGLLALIWGMDWARFWGVLSRTTPLYLALAMLLTIVSDVMRAYRWRIVLAPTKQVGVFKLFKALVIGLMANFVLPVKVGDLVRAYVVSRDEELPFATSLSTVAVERIYDALCVAVLFGLGLVLLPTRPGWLHGFGAALVGSVLIALGVLVSWNRRPELYRRLVGWLLRSAPARWRDRAEQTLEEIEGGLVSVGRPSLAARAMAVGMLSWVCLAATYYCCLLALSVEVSLPVVLVLVAALVFGFALPSLPGGTGPYQVAVVVCLTAFGVGRETAMAVSVVTLMSDLVPLVALGVVFAVLRSRVKTDATDGGAVGQDGGGAEGGDDPQVER